MKPANRQTDQELEYNIKDCFDAIKANPDNPKIYQYLQEKSACQDEMIKRAKIRMARKDLHGHIFDVMTFTRSKEPYHRKVFHRHFMSRIHGYYNTIRGSYETDRFKTALFQIGWYRKYNLI